MALVATGGNRPVRHVAPVRLIENQQRGVCLAEYVEPIQCIHCQAVWAVVRPDIQSPYVLARLQVDHAHRAATFALVRGGLHPIVADIGIALAGIHDEFIGEFRQSDMS